MTEHDDDIEDLPVPQFARGDSTNPPDDLPESAVNIAAAALRRLDGQHPMALANAAAIDPALLWTLASIVAAIVQACAQQHVKKKLARAKARPDGMLARNLRKKVMARLPEGIADADKERVANALIETGMEVVDEPRTWNR